MPAFASDRAREQYFYAYLLTPDLSTVSGVVGVTFEGADASEPLFEGRLAELEGRVVWNQAVPAGQFYAQHWVHVTKARLLPVPPQSLPAYR